MRERNGAPARGFTLTETLIVVAVVAILAALAAPSFDSLILRVRLVTFANDIVASAQLARSEAIKRNAAVVMCPMGTGVACGSDWSKGWVVKLADGGETLAVQAGLPSGWRVLEDPETEDKTLRFLPAGIGTTPGALIVCRQKPAGQFERKVTIRATGSAVSQTAPAGSCS